MSVDERKTKALRKWSVINLGRALSFIIVIAAFPVVFSYVLVEKTRNEVEDRMVAFASSVRMHVSESADISRAKVTHMESFLTDHCEIRLASTGGLFKGKKSISDFAYAIRRKASKITVLLWDREIEEFEHRADTTCTVTLKVYFPEGRESNIGLCKMQWLKLEGVWYLDKMEISPHEQEEDKS